MSSSGSPSLPRLGPTWNQGGRGFQPPPAVPAERGIVRGRSGSAGSAGSDPPKRDVNQFSALQDDDDVLDAAAAAAPAPAPVKPNSRSEALRSAPHRSASSGSKTGGRSLADLAASVPAPPPGVGRSGSGGFKEERSRFAGVRSTSTEEGSHGKVIRFTREKLLSMRPVPDKDAEYPPEHLKHLDGIVVLSKEPQDPVCYDTFEPDDIWAQVARERLPRSGSVGSAPKPAEGKRRGTVETNSGRWQRGVALPPPDESNRGGRGGRNAENPDELWDDPADATEAAADFSAFGSIPDDPKETDAFDFGAMAEASRKFELERHGSKGSDVGSEGEGPEAQMHAVQVDPKRPLASIGTTIQSGSGDGVNVFEDFETPDESGEAGKGGAVDNSASSRLMKMIGVKSDTETTAPADSSPVSSWAISESKAETKEPAPAATGSSLSISMNPWGGPVVAPGSPQSSKQQGGLDLAARLEAVVAEQQAREVQAAAELERMKSQEAEMRRRQEEEAQRFKGGEAQRRAVQAQQVQKQAEATAGMQQQQQQLEMILMERICAILEKSWGRCDLPSILATLHAEDSRVVALLDNVDTVRALIARHPRRIALRHDPSVGAEMATLLLSSAQWQQQQAQMRAQQEEMQRREQQRRMQEMQEAAQAKPTIVPDAPWFYSDPQKNIQGPFRGEEMRQWLEAGYFKGDLPISQQPNGPFVPLSTLFRDLGVAFKVPGFSEAEEQAKAAAAAAADEQEQRAAEERARAKSARAEAEAKAREAEAQARSAASSADRNQSTQLKMMLGLGSATGDSIPAPQPDDDANANRSRSQEKSAAQSNDQGVKSQQRSSSAVPAPGPSAPARSAAAAWGGATKAAPRKSMSEIQQEEARSAARLAMERKNVPRSSSGGWANIAAAGGGSTAWSSGAVKPTPPGVVTNVTAGAVPARSPQARPTQASQTSAATRRPSAPAKQPQQQASQPASQPASQQTADDFGASMPPALQTWCKEQMRKMNGSDDLTLVSFCMTLSDADEIRQYLTAYLGSTPQVNNFATDFINRKNGKSKQDEWETPGVTKKGKKKKGGK